MLWLLPAWYLSWYALSYIVPFSRTWSGLYLVSWDPVSSTHNIMIVIGFWLFGLTTFVVGSGLFIYALATMVRARSAASGLMTSGAYRWIRHPQHLGIILMLFLPTFHIYGLESVEIRLGDLVSLSSLVLLLVVIADIEEIGLSKKFGDVFLSYRLNTPFIFPFRAQRRMKANPPEFLRRRFVRYILSFVFFWSLMTLVSYAFTFLPLFYVR